MQAAATKKRRRSNDDDADGQPEPVDKKARPTLGLSSNSDSLWQPQDFYSSPSRSYHSQQYKYDSDDQSSMLSEPGSPQVLSADEEDVDMMSDDSDSAAYSQPTARTRSPGFSSGPLRAPWKTRAQAGNRIPTPMNPRPQTSPVQSHVRRRHPQENHAGERLDVPSPIDEDEVPTPPSAAEAAGSQLQLLSVSDVEMQGAEGGDEYGHSTEHIPQIAGSPSQSDAAQTPNSPFAHGPGSMMVRKQRQRSGALSAAGYGSPMRDASAYLSTTHEGDPNSAANKRGISMGYRPDCEKCRLKVPGHMNHFF